MCCLLRRANCPFVDFLPTFQVHAYADVCVCVSTSVALRAVEQVFACLQFVVPMIFFHVNAFDDLLQRGKFHQLSDKAIPSYK